VNDGCDGVKLRCTNFGIQKCTTIEWINEFVRKITKENEAPAPKPKSAARAKVSRADTKRTLDRLFPKRAKQR
jgi:hypothetical protein